MRIGICDDSLEYIEKITSIIGEGFLVETFSAGYALLDANDKDAYDLVFLDIDMPEIGGFEVAEKLKIDRESKGYDQFVVFVTNHAQLVYDSFRLAPFRFVRKSMLEREIPEALEAAQLQLERKTRVCKLKFGKEERKIQLENLLYAEVIGHKIRLHMKNRKQNEDVSISMRSLAPQLEAYDFARTHVGFLVNLSHVVREEAEWVCMDDGSQVPLSRRHKPEFHMQYIAFIRSL